MWASRVGSKHVTGIPATSHPFFVATASNDINTAYVAGGSDAGAPVDLQVDQRRRNLDERIPDDQQSEHCKPAGKGRAATAAGATANTRSASPSRRRIPLRVVITDLGGGAHHRRRRRPVGKRVYVDPADRNAAEAIDADRQAYHDSGLDNTTSWSLTWANANTMILGNSDVKGQRSTDGGLTWGFGYTGHSDNSMYRLIPRSPAAMLYAATSQRA